MRYCLVFLSVAMAWSMAVEAAATFDSATRTSTHRLESQVLGETRTILIRTPLHSEAGRRYPVVFVTDAEWNFELVASYLDYMTSNGVYPPMIVTGVTNVNRNRDYVPRADPHFEDTGQADRFLSFVKDEWIPYVQARHQGGENRVLLGHSFGGVFTLHALFSGPDLFDAYIALGTSAWIGDRVLFEEAEAFFAKHPKDRSFVYMAVGEGDGGPTVPSSRDLAQLVEEQAPSTLEWTYHETPKTDHFKNTVSGMHDAFMALFPVWGDADQLRDIATRDGAAGVNDWFERKQDRLGFRFVPAWFDLAVVALGLAREGEHIDAALAITSQLRHYHAQDPHVASFSASVYEAAGQWNHAASEYRRAIEIAEATGAHPNEIHLGRLRRSLERVTAAQAPTGAATTK